LSERIPTGYLELTKVPHHLLLRIYGEKAVAPIDIYSESGRVDEGSFLVMNNTRIQSAVDKPYRAEWDAARSALRKALARDELAASEVFEGQLYNIQIDYWQTPGAERTMVHGVNETQYEPYKSQVDLDSILSPSIARKNKVGIVIIEEEAAREWVETTALLVEASWEIPNTPLPMTDNKYCTVSEAVYSLAFHNPAGFKVVEDMISPKYYEPFERKIAQATLSLVAAAENGEITVEAKAVNSEDHSPIPDIAWRDLKIDTFAVHEPESEDNYGAFRKDAAIETSIFTNLTYLSSEIRVLHDKIHKGEETRTTAKSVGQCRNWLDGLMKSGEGKTEPKEWYQNEALRKFNGLSVRGFINAWTTANANNPHAGWDKAGRRKQS